MRSHTLPELQTYANEAALLSGERWRELQPVKMLQAKSAPKKEIAAKRKAEAPAEPPARVTRSRAAKK